MPAVAVGPSRPGSPLESLEPATDAAAPAPAECTAARSGSCASNRQSAVETKSENITGSGGVAEGGDTTATPPATAISSAAGVGVEADNRSSSTSRSRHLPTLFPRGLQQQQQQQQQEKFQQNPLTSLSLRTKEPQRLSSEVIAPLRAAPVPQPLFQLPREASAMSSRNASSGIPVARYRAKLEECASLHRQLHNMATELSVAQEQLAGSRAESTSFMEEVMRLRDVLNITTTELQTRQQRVDELERENRQLRASQTQAMSSAQRTEAFGQLRSAVGSGGTRHQSGGLATPALPSRVGSKSRRPTHSATALQLDGHRSLQLQRLLRTDVMNVTGAIEAYVWHCFRTEVVPHMELLHSLYNGGRLMAVEPPITHAQLSAMKRVLVEFKGMPSGGATEMHGTLRLSSLRSPSSSASVSSSWVNQVELLSFRTDAWHANIGLLMQMIRMLSSVRRVELFAVSDTTVMQQLAETLLMELHVEVLTLPEVSLTDEGLAILFSLITRREQLATGCSVKMTSPSATTDDFPADSMMQESDVLSPADCSHTAVDTNADTSAVAPEAAPASAGVAVVKEDEEPQFKVQCLDLSRCTITHPTTLFRTFRGPTVEVLVLTGCTTLRDVHVRGILEACPKLHTLDLSGDDGLTTACVTYISQHERLKVLRLENCPGIKQLELANIEVLFSSLAYVAMLRAPELRRLPVPLTHSHVLFDFFAPKLTEITLKGIVVDRGTLGAFIHRSNSENNGDRCVTPKFLMASASVLSVGTAQQQSCDMVQLLSAGFIDCLIASSSELEAFVKQQTHLVRLSLHGCKGVVDAHLARLPLSLLELDVGGVAQLTGSSIDAIATRLPQLIKLSLKNAGNAIGNAEVRHLHGMASMEVLNLLGLPQLLPETVAGIVMALPRLRVLYHETAVVSTNLPTSVLRVERTDEEDTTRQDINHCAKELLQLRNETALSLWMEAQLPKPATLLPSRPTTTCGIDVGAPNPPLTINTTFYEVAQQSLSRQGTRAAGSTEASSTGTAAAKARADDCQQQGEPDVLTFTSGDDGAVPRPPMDADNDDDDDNEDDDAKSRRSAADARRAIEDAMDEKGRIAIEKAPLGPWDESDIVAERRR